jgi:hypothetical protein
MTRVAQPDGATMTVALVAEGRAGDPRDHVDVTELAPV